MRRLTVLLLFASLAMAEDPPIVAQGPESMLDDYLIGIARPYWEARSRAAAGLRTPAQVEERQRWARRRFIELLGGLPAKTPLDPHITGTIQRDGYRIEKLIFESLPRFYVTANVYVPSRGRPPYPAILGLMGHYALSKAEPTHPRVWTGVAQCGFVVRVLDALRQGKRVQCHDTDLGRSRPRQVISAAFSIPIRLGWANSDRS